MSIAVRTACVVQPCYILGARRPRLCARGQWISRRHRRGRAVHRGDDTGRRQVRHPSVGHARAHGPAGPEQAARRPLCCTRRLCCSPRARGAQGGWHLRLCQSIWAAAGAPHHAALRRVARRHRHAPPRALCQHPRRRHPLPNSARCNARLPTCSSTSPGASSRPSPLPAATSSTSARASLRQWRSARACAASRGCGATCATTCCR